MSCRWIIVLFLAAASLSAQQAENTPPKPADALHPASTLPKDPSKLAELIRASYYHPDDLSNLDCAVSVDWDSFFQAARLTVPDARMKTIRGVKIQSLAVRGKAAEVTFDWTAGPPDTREQFEGGIRQMIQGYFQMYWPMIASTPFKSAEDLTDLETLPDGGAKATAIAPNLKVTMTIDRDAIPTHYSIDSPAMKGTMEPHYTPSPKPTPGDIRRISSMDVSEQMGTSTINVQLSLDYQDLNAFHIPRHVSFALIGAYSIPMEFSNCSIHSGDASQSR